MITDKEGLEGLRNLNKKKCDSCGKINWGPHKEGDSYDHCCNPLYNEYGKFYTSQSVEEMKK